MESDHEDQLEWRDTYFILMQNANRPTLTQVESAITEATKRVTLERLSANDDGMFQSVLVQAPQDNAAMEINYEAGEAVIVQSAELAKQLKGELDKPSLAKLLSADARLDIMHFERLTSDAYGDEMEEDWDASALDPSSLINIVDALSKLTGGIPIDPASGAMLT